MFNNIHWMLLVRSDIARYQVLPREDSVDFGFEGLLDGFATDIAFGRSPRKCVPRNNNDHVSASYTFVEVAS